MSITDRPAPANDAYRALGNGKLVELMKFALPILLSLIAAYLTANAQTQAAIEESKRQIAVVVERENNHFLELRAALADLREEIRLLRRER